ncbi:hypothetical protein BD410DRAFT_844072 [Rickenella mellea]|uniref:Uncharacterized protein n=1 Tax=Rickenella mellea TaxID=50990 RepID=A0A4Y7PNX4_9AGAM|nr:hypothetical protein BD410DRAFT_844072 [Rickenella mellea]
MPPYGSITAFECRYDPNGLQQPVSDRGQGCVGAPNPALIIIGREDIRYCQMHSVEFFFLERNTACYIHQGLQRLHVYIFSASQGGQPIPVDEVWKHTLPKDLCKELGIPEPELISAPLLRQNPLVIPSSYHQLISLIRAIQQHMRMLESWICLAEEKAACLRACGVQTHWKFPTGDHYDFICVGPNAAPPSRPQSPLPTGPRNIPSIQERLQWVWFNRGNRHVDYIPVTERQADEMGAPMASNLDSEPDGDELEKELRRTACEVDELYSTSDPSSSSMSPLYDPSTPYTHPPYNFIPNNPYFCNLFEDEISSDSESL